MTEDLQREIAHAIVAGLDLDEIQEAIIDPAPLDADEKAALWLYADVIRERPTARILGELASVPVLV
jgi:hypothetical protein